VVLHLFLKSFVHIFHSNRQQNAHDGRRVVNAGIHTANFYYAFQKTTENHCLTSCVRKPFDFLVLVRCLKWWDEPRYYLIYTRMSLGRKNRFTRVCSCFFKSLNVILAIPIRFLGVQQYRHLFADLISVNTIRAHLFYILYLII